MELEGRGQGNKSKLTGTVLLALRSIAHCFPVKFSALFVGAKLFVKCVHTKITLNAKALLVKLWARSPKPGSVNAEGEECNIILSGELSSTSYLVWDENPWDEYLWE